MSIPKSLLTERGDLTMNDALASLVSPQQVQAHCWSDRVSSRVWEKNLVVQWQGLEEVSTVAAPVTGANTDTSAAELNLKGGPHHVDCTEARQRAKKRRSSLSPPVSQTLDKLQKRLQRQEAQIRHACKLELQLLNQSKQVREKRARMVGRLGRIKKKVRKLTVLESINNDKGSAFVLPPVFKPVENRKQKEPLVIDMTGEPVTSA